MAELERADHGEAGEPAVKRARLESVVPAPAPPTTKQVAKQPPPMPKPVAPPLWFSGQLPPKASYNSRDGGPGSNYGWMRGGGGRGGRGRGRGSGRGKN
jgi:hypothetical protein